MFSYYYDIDMYMIYLSYGNNNNSNVPENITSGLSVYILSYLKIYSCWVSDHKYKNGFYLR